MNQPDREAQILADLERRRQDAIRRTFTRFDPVALGAGIGVCAALFIALVTVRLIAGEASEKVQMKVGLLTHFFPGYDITASGAAIGAGWFLVVGFVLGFLIASFRNLALRLVLWKMSADAARFRRRHLLDEI
jgi:hypothetical protein